MDILWFAVRVTFALGMLSLRIIWSVGVPIARVLANNPRARRVALIGGAVAFGAWMLLQVLFNLALALGIAAVPQVVAMSVM